MINIKDKLKRSNILIKRTNDANVEYVPLNEFEADIKAINERINDLSGADIDADDYMTKLDFEQQVTAIEQQISQIPEKKVNANGINFANSTFEEVSDAFYFGDVTNFKGIFSNCRNLKRVNADLTGSMATSNDKSEMFYGCGALEEAPYFIALRVSSMEQMYYNCSALQTVPSYNILECVSMYQMFRDCDNLISVGDMDENPDNWLVGVSEMFYNCESLIIAPRIKTTHVKYFNSMFYHCSSLITAPAYDASNATDVTNIFQYCYKLEKFGGLQNIKIDLDLRNCHKLNYESMINQINGLYDFRGNGDNETTRTLKLFYNSKDELTDDDIAIATNKGWVITFSF